MATNTNVSGKKVAVLVTDGFEQVELTGPKKALEAAGAQVSILAPQNGTVQGFNHADKADSFQVERTIADARPEDFDAVLLPGGVQNADALRVDEDARAFVKGISAQGKPIAVICHGPWLLIDAELVQGRTLTSWPSLKVDLTNAGASWVDAQVHVDHQLVSSRKPDDIPAFNEQFLKVLGAPA
ncbi:type 1 glutamine amidotransferase domain-containing protein [Pantoea sp. 18069]|uniref:type 1 glutamine amidotransferase domain-containing protein n=1 Tax=Pantoea sp. 18069 TaxID=2681415 RepID=UPI0013596BAB|nr:type 1 glutamine amidotransferase domain-containing protein [Pantoea sp. 18069]